jgi:hypothetical protein
MSARGSAELYIQHLTPLPNVLCRIIGAYYDSLTSELVSQYLSRHKSRTIELKPSNCRKSHFNTTLIEIALAIDKDQCEFFAIVESADVSRRYFIQALPLISWDTSVNIEWPVMCKCKQSQLELTCRMREVCELELREAWAKLLCDEFIK